MAFVNEFEGNGFTK